MSLVEAWRARSVSAAADLHHAIQAPGLFKPEFVEQRQVDYFAAKRQVAYWQSQVTA
jgi:hypothetical protein